MNAVASFFFAPSESLTPVARWFFAAAALLLALGLAALYSASGYKGYDIDGDPGLLLRGQAQGLLLGGIALAVGAQVRPQLWLRGAPALFVLVLALLVLVFVPGFGIEYNQATRWLRLGLVFQPSELAKLAVPLLIAWGYARYGPLGPARPRARRLLHLNAIALLGLVAGLVALEPDYGSSFFIFGVGAVLLLVARVPVGYFVAALVAALPAVLVLFKLRSKELLERIDGLLNPMSVYQVERSLLAIGSGGLAGKGFGNGLEKQGLLPEAHNDFIFAVFAEETGLIGVALVLVLFSLLLQSGWRILRQCPDAALRLWGLGILINIVFQACVNIAVATASAPTKGITLPFFSHGSTGLTILLFQIGVLLAISRVRQETPR